MRWVPRGVTRSSTGSIDREHPLLTPFLLRTVKELSCDFFNFSKLFEMIYKILSVEFAISFSRE